MALTIVAEKSYMEKRRYQACAGLLLVLTLAYQRAAMADAVDRVVAIDNDARAWAEQHVPTEFRANSILRACADNNGDFAECKALGRRLELLSSTAIGLERLAFETLGDIVLKNAAGMEFQAEPDGLTDGAVTAILSANDAAQKKRLRIMVRDAKGLDASPIVRYLKAFPPETLPG